MDSELVVTTREVKALRIPSGEEVVIPAGTQVMVTQALGGTITVSVGWGNLARIAGTDADALGPRYVERMNPTVDKPACEKAAGAAEGSLERQVWEQLATCYDPEIPVNIVDLGLVYEMKIEDHPEGGKKVVVRMTLTAPGCGMGPVLQQDARQKIEALPGVKQADIEVVWEPMWNQSMMSEAAKLQLGMH